MAAPPPPAGLDPALLAVLDDPEFVASLGSTDEEREQIVRDLRALFEDSSSVQFDPEQLRAMVAEKNEHDAAVAQQEEEERVAAEEATKAEADRLEALKAGPTYDELVEAQTDGSENYDYSQTPQHWAGVEGASETLSLIHI